MAYLGRGMICGTKAGGSTRVTVFGFASPAVFGGGEYAEAEGEECEKEGDSKDSLVSLVWVEESGVRLGSAVGTHDVVMSPMCKDVISCRLGRGSVGGVPKGNQLRLGVLLERQYF